MKLLGIVLTAAIVATAPAAGQTAAMAAAAGDDCGSFVTCAGGLHAVLDQMYDDGKGIHDNCKLCRYTSSGQQAPTWMCHGPCDQAAADSQTYKELLEAVRSGDLQSAVLIAAGSPHLASVNSQRGSLQIMSCDGSSISGNIPLPPQYVAWLPVRNRIALRNAID